MTRVRLKNKIEDVTGTIVDGEAQPGEVCVRWDDRDNELPYRIAYDRLEVIEPERDIHLALLDALDRLRDSFNLAIECCIRDIQREMKK